MKKSLSFAFAVALVLSAALPFSAAAADSCAPRMEQVLYKADFAWNALTGVEGASAQQQKGRKMKIIIGVLKGTRLAGAKAPFAQIWSDGACQATCKLKSLEKEGQLQPISMDMECQGVGFSPLAMNASVLWGGTTSRFQAEKATIRFGTWLQGYQLAELNVQVDRYKNSELVNRQIALNR